MKPLLKICTIIGLLSLVSCTDDETTEPNTSVKDREAELLQWQAKAEAEFEKRQIAEAAVVSTSARANSMQRAATATGIAAVAFLFLGGAMGSKAKKDALES